MLSTKRNLADGIQKRGQTVSKYRANHTRSGGGDREKYFKCKEERGVDTLDYNLVQR